MQQTTAHIQSNIEQKRAEPDCFQDKLDYLKIKEAKKFL